MGNYTPRYSLSAIIVCSGKGVSLLLERSVSSPTDPLHQMHILPTEVQKCSICETRRAKRVCYPALPRLLGKVLFSLSVSFQPVE